MNMKNKKKKSGFTLVELLVTIVIIGIVTGLSFPIIKNIQEANKQRQIKLYMDSLVYSAKMYVDSYEEDLFGHEKSGCALIKYSDMSNRKLLKDIELNNISCNSDDTYVRTVKVDDKFSYRASIGCGSVGPDGKVIVDIKNTEDVGDTCSFDSVLNMDIVANPDESPSIDKKRKNITIKIGSFTGINSNPIISYGFSYNKDVPEIIGNWEKLPISVLNNTNQLKKIESGEKIIIESEKLLTPANETGDLYLFLKIDRLHDLEGRNWTKNVTDDSLLFGPYRVDNEKPLFNDSTIISSNAYYNALEPKLNLKATDNYTSNDDLKMCISYDSDTCSKKVSDIKTKYEKYNASKVLGKVSNKFDGSTHKIYVTIGDKAGNYQTKQFNYQVAREWTIKFDSNGGNNCSPAQKSVIFNSSETRNWGDLCIPSRTGYTFKGWNTKKDGTGTIITKDSQATSDLTVYAQWEINTCKVKYVANGGTFTASPSQYSPSQEYAIYNYGTTITNLRDARDSGYKATRSGYHLEEGKEWISESDKVFSQARNQKYDLKELCPDIEIKSQDTVLKANWKIINYSITYHLDGGSVSGNPTTYNVNSAKITLRNPSRSGYVFKGWTGSNGTTPQTSVTISKGSTGNKSYTAHWAKAISCRINASINGTTVTSTLIIEGANKNNYRSYGIKTVDDSNDGTVSSNNTLSVSKDVFATPHEYYRVNGYVKDKAGNEATCFIHVSVIYMYKWTHESNNCENSKRNYSVQRHNCICAGNKNGCLVSSGNNNDEFGNHPSTATFRSTETCNDANVKDVKSMSCKYFSRNYSYFHGLTFEDKSTLKMVTSGFNWAYHDHWLGSVNVSDACNKACVIGLGASDNSSCAIRTTRN